MNQSRSLVFPIRFPGKFGGDHNQRPLKGKRGNNPPETNPNKKKKNPFSNNSPITFNGDEKSLHSQKEKEQKQRRIRKKKDQDNAAHRGGG